MCLVLFHNLLVSVGLSSSDSPLDSDDELVWCLTGSVIPYVHYRREKNNLNQTLRFACSKSYEEPRKTSCQLNSLGKCFREVKNSSLHFMKYGMEYGVKNGIEHGMERDGGSKVMEACKVHSYVHCLIPHIFA